MDDKKLNELESKDEGLSQDNSVDESKASKELNEEEILDVATESDIGEDSVVNNTEKQVEQKDEVLEEVTVDPMTSEVIEEPKDDTDLPENKVDEEKEPTKEFQIVNNVEPQKNIEPETEEVSKKKSKKKLIIIVSIAALLIIATVVVVVLLMNKDKKKSEDKPKEPEVVEPTISDEEAQQIMNEYGNKLAIFVREHIAKGYDVATIKQDAVTSLVEGYTVSCEVFSIENNGNIKLDKCKVNNSDAKFSYEKTYSAKPDSNYLILSKNGVLTFYYDGWYATSEEEFVEEEYEIEYYDKHVLKCEETSCVLDKIFADHVIVKEQSGKSNVYRLKDNKKIYTALAGYELNFLGQYDKEYNEQVLGVIIRNPEGQEALYSITKNEIVIDYGVYTYDWDNGALCYHSCDTNIVENFIRVHKGNLTGLISASTFEEVLEPGDYKNLTAGKKYVFIQESGYKGIMKYNEQTKKVEMLIKPNKYTDIEVDGDYIYVENTDKYGEKKYGVYDGNTGEQLLNGKYYDAVIANSADGGRVFVLDGNILKLLDLTGKMITKVYEFSSEVYPSDDILTYGSGSYKDEEDEISFYLKLVNHEYNPDANAEYELCYNECKIEHEDGDCDLECEHLYDYEATLDCVEYNYYLSTGKLEKYPIECEGGYAKPVLYLYPKLTSIIRVTFENADKLTTTYPKYNNGWTVLANTNGDLYDENGKYYYALYWEEDSNHKVDFSEGFYVTKNNAIEFLEESLTKMGFNDRERNEFIMYWLPILEKNEKSLVYFELTEERDSYSKININPQPDSLLRVAIHVKKVDSYTPIKEQHLPRFERNGFVAVEWGGVLY